MGVNNFLSFVLLLSALTLIYIGYYSWKRNKIYVSISLLPVSIYAFGYAFEISCTSIQCVKFWIKIEYLGIPFLAVVWLMLALDFTGYKEKIKKNILALSYIIPIIIVILNYTNDFHHLFYKKLYMNYDGIFPIVEITQGPWYWVNIEYTYALMMIGLIIFILTYLKSVSIVRKQILLLIMAWVIPWISNTIYLLKLLPFNLDIGPLALAFSGVMYSFAILKFKFLKLTPIALEKVFFSVSEGIIIIDSENNIVNFNNVSKNIISELKYIQAGDKKIDEVLKEYEMLLNIVNDVSCNEGLLSIKDKEQLRYYKINVNNVCEKSDKIIGKVLILHDVTEIEIQKRELTDNFNFLQTLMDAIPNPIYSKNKHGVYNHCNIAFTEFLGMNKEEFIGNTAYDVFEEKSAKTYDELDKKLMNKKGTQVYEEKLIHRDCMHHDVIFNKSVVVNEDDNVKGLVGVIIDITEQKKNIEKINKLLKLKGSMLKMSYSINEISNINNLLQLMLNEVINCIDDRSCGSVLLLDKNDNLKIAVAKGYNSEEIKIFKFKLGQHFGWFNEKIAIEKTVILNDIDKMKNVKMLNTDEGIKIKSAISSPIIIDGKLYGFLNIDSIYNNMFNEGDLELMEYMRNQVSIVIKNHRLYEETVYLSRYDKLTNVYNRSYFEQLLYTEINKNNEYKREFFLIVFDLNDLKFVNDNYGHLAGDELIKTFSRGLSGLAKEFDIIGRFGGDEFVGAFFNIHLQRLVNKLQELIEYFKSNPIIYEGNNIVCSYSYGIVSFPRDGTEFNKLIKIADKRMYEYKKIVKSKNKTK
ncbi:diguanylate cyclase (GGDEF)-like protein/PAS domain S-box-containing protein [Clostridium saccharobutylicum]|uniref:PAS domain S-box/diguanylate cyclase (GGDEF) domain-containing protein n=2 Tax=Clostridium saccharobutylicum TaxID=169679 RepID=U5MRD1_CLOSA|nr:histidine kinase N-terminal 7TM domain-containing protein [Clostridium saccharobutylicum]AGX43160.1 PAS domain S-box/diguanylate cyclase (GGDEF) domain-containing protein [Clostridium saccharobutylicum DSM 13864]AQR90462.1 phytochrome-like protein cph2 [Clostridium saccharobutylicum]AQS00368.1 phytochrome-like protein cph2 [Clostridium saccharobutylicum]AQS14351.1 phytochrome-like protein cph2 [Clostridium saccharobutylicum]MBA2906634.1 diguanylate cyclase (GGDEF)-like protein/PAS domain S-